MVHNEEVMVIIFVTAFTFGFFVGMIIGVYFGRKGDDL